jgi:O-acetylserine/cysteine efflux transporter
VKPARLLLLLGITLAWGLHFSVIKVTVDDVPPLFYVSLRMALVALLLTPFRRWHPGKMRTILIAGACFGGLNYAFMFWGLKLTTASVSAVVIESYVPIATLFSVLFLGERVGLPRIAGMTVALLGVAVIATGRSDATGSVNLPLGALCIVTAATFEAAGAIFVKKVTGVSALGLLSWFGVVGASVTGLLSLLFERGQLEPFAPPTDWSVVAALAYSVLVASIFAHASYYYLLQRVEVSRLAGSGLLASVFAVGFGVTLLGEPLSPRFVVGGLMTLAGVGIVLLRQEKARTKLAPEPVA